MTEFCESRRGEAWLSPEDIVSQHDVNRSRSVGSFRTRVMTAQIYGQSVRISVARRQGNPLNVEEST